MNILEIITKKKLNQPLTQEEINYVVTESAINKTIPDYQLAALLMAFRLNGMSDEETYYLTKAFIDTSEQFNFKKHPHKIVIDKHSSGGVGDKVSLIIIPILHALGFEIAKISGRGLGHTGGTIDKLDAVGFNSSIDMQQAQNTFDTCGMVLMQQTPKLVPADKLFYALRDVTATVDTIGLIISSILSKKFVLNSDYIFIDLKVGSGALIKTVEEATELAHKMIKVATLCKRKLFIHLTNMQNPLGNAIGNKIEVKEAIDFLLNQNVNQELKSLIETFSVDILLATNKACDKQTALDMYQQVISSKAAYNSFILWMQTQGVDVKQFTDPSFYQPKYAVDVQAKDSGFLEATSASDIGMIGVMLGAGRMTKEDQLDFDAGIYFHKNIGTEVKQGEIFATLYSSHPISKEIAEKFVNLFKYTKKAPKNDTMIITSFNN